MIYGADRERATGGREVRQKELERNKKNESGGESEKTESPEKVE